MSRQIGSVSEDTFQRRALILTSISEYPGITRMELEKFIPRESFTLQEDLVYLRKHGHISATSYHSRNSINAPITINQYYLLEDMPIQK